MDGVDVSSLLVKTVFLAPVGPFVGSLLGSLWLSGVVERPIEGAG